MYVPDPETLTRLANDAGVYLVSDQEWRRRSPLACPGLVWMIETDTCMAGRPEAADNVAYDEYGCEFIYRQPRNDAELEAVLRAAYADPFEGYRFDGLDRWTCATALEWYEGRHSLIAQLEKTIPFTEGELEQGTRAPSEADMEIAEAIHAACEHYRSAEFEATMAATLAYLR